MGTEAATFFLSSQFFVGLVTGLLAVPVSKLGASSYHWMKRKLGR